MSVVLQCQMCVVYLGYGCEMVYGMERTTALGQMSLGVSSSTAHPTLNTLRRNRGCWNKKFQLSKN